jgi:hypothetical protein
MNTTRVCLSATLIRYVRFCKETDEMGEGRRGREGRVEPGIKFSRLLINRLFVSYMAPFSLLPFTVLQLYTHLLHQAIMSSVSSNLSEHRPRKRKAANACDFCKRRKVFLLN